MRKGRIFLVLCLALAMLCAMAFVSCDFNLDSVSQSFSQSFSQSSESSESASESESESETESVSEVESVSESVHTHSFGEWSTIIAPSCVLDGIKSRACEGCSLTELEKISALGHTSVIDDGIEPTCIADGMTQGAHCSTCDAILEKQEVIGALGHSYDNSVITDKASCLKDGTIKYTCSVNGCGDFYTESFSLPVYDATELYEDAIKYVGEILVYDRSGMQLALGTGFVISEDGKIVTNYHVIDGGYYAKIIIQDKEYQITSVLGADKDIDLAVLKVNATNLDYAPVCKEPLKTGMAVYAIGSSRGLTNSYSKGIISYASRVLEGVEYIQHDASITHGNSGGPLINEYGEVVGINTWGILDSQNLNFAVFAGELDNLSYDTELSLTEFYEKYHDGYEILLSWVKANYTTSESGQLRFDYKSDAAWYSVGYDTEDDFLYIDVLYTLDSGAQAYALIDLSGDQSTYTYFAQYAQGTAKNTTQGQINPSTFSESSALTYTSSQGGSWSQSDLLEFYQASLVDLITWLDWATGQYSIGMNIADLGFMVFKK